MDCEDYVTPGSPIDQYLKSIADFENDLPEKLKNQQSAKNQSQICDVLRDRIFFILSEIRSYFRRIETENRFQGQKLELTAKKEIKKAISEILSDENLYLYETDLDVLAVKCESYQNNGTAASLTYILPITVAQAVYIASYWNQITTIYSFLHILFFVISLYFVLWWAIFELNDDFFWVPIFFWSSHTTDLDIW